MDFSNKIDREYQAYCDGVEESKAQKQDRLAEGDFLDLEEELKYRLKLGEGEQ